MALRQWVKGKMFRKLSAYTQRQSNHNLEGTFWFQCRCHLSRPLRPVLRVNDLPSEPIPEQFRVLPLRKAEDIEANAVTVEEMSALAEAQVVAEVVELEVLIASAEASL